MDRDIAHMQVRLFVDAWKKWNTTIQRCAEIFDAFDVDQYIADSYEFFHVQGDETNLYEIEEYLARRGVVI